MDSTRERVWVHELAEWDPRANNGRGEVYSLLPVPGDFTPVLLEGPLKELSTTVALTFYAPAEAKRSGTTLEEFKAAVERFDFIVR